MKRWSCSRCGKRFASEGATEQHIKDMHKGGYPVRVDPPIDEMSEWEIHAELEGLE